MPRQGEHLRLHPMCTARDPGWGRGGAGGSRLSPLPPPSKALPPSTLQPAPVPTQGLSLTFPPELYLINVTFSTYFYAGKKSWTRCSSPALPHLMPAQPPVFARPVSPLPLCRAERAPGCGGLAGAPQLLTGLQAPQDLPWLGHRVALGPGSAIQVPTQCHPHWRVAWLRLWWVSCCAWQGLAGLGLVVSVPRRAWSIPCRSHACELLGQAQPCPSGSPHSAHWMHVLQSQASA